MIVKVEVQSATAHVVVQTAKSHSYLSPQDNSSLTRALSLRPPLGCPVLTCSTAQCKRARLPNRHASQWRLTIPITCVFCNTEGTHQCATGAGKAAGAGVNMLYAGLKFTGLALSVAGDLAKAVRQDAERMAKELEADSAARVRLLSPALLCPGVMSYVVCNHQLYLAPLALLLRLSIGSIFHCPRHQVLVFFCWGYHAPSLHAPATLLLMLVSWSATHSQLPACSQGKKDQTNTTRSTQRPSSVIMALIHAAYPALPAEAVQGERSSFCGPDEAGSAGYHFPDQL